MDFSNFKNHPKWIIGYSDVTVLHAHLHQLGIETLHAQMPLSIETKSDATINSIKATLFGEHYRIKVLSEKNNSTGKASGQLIGGNLSILYSLCGSPSALNTKGKILFIEDLDEYLYHIDRMLYALKRAGMLENLAGLLVGGMSDMKDNAIPFGKNAEEIIRDVVAEYNFPVAFNFPAGHIDHNMPLIFGKKLVFEVGKTVKLHEIHS